ncbi:MAG: phospho-sugar mutase, partial [Clostridia bacterium]|nr:phospho-sugar mutase [Clostridia bacterium]
MIKEMYELWLENATLDPDLTDELIAIKDDPAAIEDAFYTELSFGTAGLRGVIGAGTNRMNVYTVGKATQGLAVYVKSLSKNPKVAIAYDSRIKSETFARAAAEILAANGVKVYIYRELEPTPMLSYAVRYFGCDSGIVITASHNPAKYNGYKAYGADGCQMGPEAADYVLSIMNKIDVFKDIKRIDFESGVKSGIIEYISDEAIESYLDEVEKCRVNKDLDLSGIKILYTPLNGAGNKPVRRIFERIGACDVTVVKEQELPDGNFPTAPYPNPEFKEAFACAFETAKNVHPDLIIATDPDSDRAGIAVLIDGEYRLFTGNDVGALLLDYVLKCRKELGTLPNKPVAVKSIVSTEICKKIAAEYGCELRDVLTGFKFIGEQIGE